MSLALPHGVESRENRCHSAHCEMLLYMRLMLFLRVRHNVPLTWGYAMEATADRYNEEYECHHAQSDTYRARSEVAIANGGARTTYFAAMLQASL